MGMASPEKASMTRTSKCWGCSRPREVRVARVVGGGCAAEFVAAEVLGAVLDDAVHQCAFGDAGVGEGLFDAEGGVEIPHRHGGAALGSYLKHEDQDQQHDRGDRPEKALAPATVPGDGEGEEGGDEDGDGQDVGEGEE